MPKTITKKNLYPFTYSTIELVKWPVSSVLAFQTTCHHPVKKNTPHIETETETNTKNTSSYKGFNLGFHVGDNPTTVKSNRDYIADKIIDGREIQWLEQVHGSEVAYIDKVANTPLVADACITEKDDIALAIMTADCLPILLSNKEGTKIAAIHGGWRPLAANIVAKTITKMDVKVTELVAWLGPCIGQDAFEVGEDVYNIFITSDPLFSSAFQAKGGGKYFANLHTIARIQLEKLGVSLIATLEECTYTNENKYYSYRRNSITGRMATVIYRMK